MFSQPFTTGYSPMENYRIDSLELQQITQRFTDRCNELKQNQNSIDAKATKEIYKDLTDMLTRLDTLNYLMYNDLISEYCQGVLKRIVQANPELKDKKYVLFVRRTIIPNASSLSEGVININLDLLTKMNSESEIAFVICHELAHDYLEHVFLNIQKIVKIQNDKKLKIKLKKARKQHFNQMSTMDSLVTGVILKYTQYTRQDEMSADSLGFLFFVKAGFDPDIAEKTMLLLDSLDNFLFKKDLKIENVFSFPNYPFNPLWTYEDTTDLNWVGNVKKEIPDSLKTHPNCKLRAEALESYAAEVNTKGPYHERNFMNERTYCTFEMIEHLGNIKAYDYALYFSLSMLQQYPDNLYLHCSVANSLFEIGDALKNHKFSKVVNFTNSEYPEAFNKLLRILNQLTFSELNNMMESYFDKYVKSFSANDPYAAYLKILIKSRNVETDMILNQIEAYKSNYSENLYTKKLVKKFLKKT
jgi:hypothetical protein